MLRTCVKCLYNELHPFGITFDKYGLCSGCKVHQEKNIIDWEKREKKLFDLVRDYKSDNSYDCVVPITAGQDSFFILHYVKKVLNLNPLVINFNRVMNSREGITNFAILREQFGVDVHQVTMSSTTIKKIIKVTLENLGTLNWYWIAGQTALPVRTAVDFNIPLIIWGAHQGVEQVGMHSYYDEVEMTKRYRKEHDLMGYDEERILDFDCDFSRNDLSLIKYPSDREIITSQVRGIYLSNFIRWDSVEQHRFVRKKYGYLGKKTKRSYYQYDNPDCPVYMCLQDELKMIKYGYSKVTDQLCRDIRFGRMNRSIARLLNSYYAKKSNKSCNTEFESWLGASRGSLELVKLRYTNHFLQRLDSADRAIKIYNEGLNSSDTHYKLFGKGTR